MSQKCLIQTHRCPNRPVSGNTETSCELVTLTQFVSSTSCHTCSSLGNERTSRFSPKTRRMIFGRNNFVHLTDKSLFSESRKDVDYPKFTFFEIQKSKKTQWTHSARRNMTCIIVGMEVSNTRIEWHSKQMKIVTSHCESQLSHTRTYSVTKVILFMPQSQLMMISS